MPKISPLYTIQLINKISTTLWDIFPDRKYVNVEQYIKRWHEDDLYDDYGNFIQPENFHIEYQHETSNIDLMKTLGNIDEETLLKMAIELGIETPKTIPAIVEIKEILAKDYTDVASTFQKAYKKIYDEPSIAIVLANSALEAIIKRICKEEQFNSCNNKDTLYDLISHILKEYNYFPNATLNNNIKKIGSSLLNACQAIESIRSENTEGHGKIVEDYVINDPLYSAFILNAITTVGLFLLNYYETRYKEGQETILISDDEIPF